MARNQGVRVTRSARLGLAAVAAAVLVGLGAYVGVSLERGNGGYRFGVHFPTAAGIGPGAQVFLSGVNIGSVAKVEILPDTSVDFIVKVNRATDIPRNAKFSVQSSLTGSPSVTITVPRSAARPWPRRVLPIYEQPTGTPPLTIEAVLRQSRALGNRLDAMLAQARPYGGPLLGHVRRTRANGTAIAAQLRTTGPQLLTTVQTTIKRAKANAASAQAAVQERDRPRLAALAKAFRGTLADMRASARTLQQLRSDPQARTNLRQARIQLRTVTANLAALSRDMSAIAGNPQTKAELRDASAQFRALLEKF